MYRKSLRTDSPKHTRSYVSSILRYIYKEKFVSKTDLDKFIEMLISNQVNRVVKLASAITEPMKPRARNQFKGWYNKTNKDRSRNWNLVVNSTRK